jgi:hypothetical protein
MTPKEKALQLVDYFTEIDQFTEKGSKIYYHDSVKCALRVVDEIIMLSWSMDDYKNAFYLQNYWSEVKQELYKL